MEPSHGYRSWTSCSLPHPAHVHHHHHFPHHRHHSFQHHHHHDNHHQHRPLIIFPHHHHLIICPCHCHHNQHHHLNCHCNVNASYASFPLQNSEHFGAFPLKNESNSEAEDTIFKDDPNYETQMFQEQGYEAEEEIEEPAFVLTDEWREFFAASEAKRKKEKKTKKK